MDFDSGYCCVVSPPTFARMRQEATSNAHLRRSLSSDRSSFWPSTSQSRKPYGECHVPPKWCTRWRASEIFIISMIGRDDGGVAPKKRAAGLLQIGTVRRAGYGSAGTLTRPQGSTVYSPVRTRFCFLLATSSKPTLAEARGILPPGDYDVTIGRQYFRKHTAEICCCLNGGGVHV